MAVYGEFGFDIGAGVDFSLPHYYGMCAEIVEASAPPITLYATPCGGDYRLAVWFHT